MIKYSVIPVSKAEDVAKFLLGSFFREEPLGIALDLPVSEAARWLPTYIAYAVSQSVSVMAVESDTNTIVGVLVCGILDPSTPPKVTMPDLIDNEKEPTMALIARILSTNWENNPSPKEKTLIHMFLNVDSNYAGKGIGKQLIDQVESRAVEHFDIHLTMVDTTSHFSYRAYEKRGYEVNCAVEYVTIEDGANGRPLESKADKLGVHTHLRLLSKTL